jgi:hypothetical protein
MKVTSQIFSLTSLMPTLDFSRVFHVQRLCGHCSTAAAGGRKVNRLTEFFGTR